MLALSESKNMSQKTLGRRLWKLELSEKDASRMS